MGGGTSGWVGGYAPGHSTEKKGLQTARDYSAQRDAEEERARAEQAAADELYAKAHPIRNFMSHHPCAVLLGVLVAMGGCTTLTSLSDTRNANAAAAKGVQALRDIAPLNSYSQADGQQIIDDVQNVCKQLGSDCAPVKWDPQSGRIMSGPLTKENLVSNLIYAGDHVTNLSDPKRARIFRDLATELAPFKRTAVPGTVQAGVR